MLAFARQNISIYCSKFGAFYRFMTRIRRIMSTITLPSNRAARDLRRLGENITIARKRRRFTQQRLADGASVSRTTIRRLEQGDPGVSLGALAMVLLTLGESGRLEAMLEVARDDIGLGISVSELPQRVRPQRKPKTDKSADQADSTSTATSADGKSYDPGVF
jgi:transcriptional regulator with XRE-family HTH domain